MRNCRKMLATSWRAAFTSVSASSLLFKLLRPVWFVATSAWSALAWSLVSLCALRSAEILDFRVLREFRRLVISVSPAAITHFRSVALHFVCWLLAAKTVAGSNAPMASRPSALTIVMGFVRKRRLNFFIVQSLLYEKISVSIHATFKKPARAAGADRLRWSRLRLRCWYRSARHRYSAQRSALAG